MPLNTGKRWKARNIQPIKASLETDKYGNQREVKPPVTTLMLQLQIVTATQLKHS